MPAVKFGQQLTRKMFMQSWFVSWRCNGDNDVDDDKNNDTLDQN